MKLWAQHMPWGIGLKLTRSVVKQSSRGCCNHPNPPIKICCISYNSEARTRTLQGNSRDTKLPLHMKKFRGTILNFHESQNILKELFFFFDDPWEKARIHGHYPQNFLRMYEFYKWILFELWKIIQLYFRVLTHYSLHMMISTKN